MKNIAKTEKIKNSKERLKGIIMGRKSNVLVLEKHILKGRCCEYNSITFYPKRKKNQRSYKYSNKYADKNNSIKIRLVRGQVLKEKQK